MAVYEAIFSREWSGDLQLKQFKHNGTLRSSAAVQLEIPLVSLSTSITEETWRSVGILQM